MTVAERQARLIEDFSIIENRLERLGAVVSHAKNHTPFPAADRNADHRVPGCVSAVWLTGRLVDGRLRLACDAESPLVKGLVGLLVELYDDSLPADAAATEPDLLQRLDLLRDLSPTRQNGLAAVRRRIREIALALA